MGEATRPPAHDATIPADTLSPLEDGGIGVYDDEDGECWYLDGHIDEAIALHGVRRALLHAWAGSPYGTIEHVDDLLNGGDAAHAWEAPVDCWEEFWPDGVGRPPVPAHPDGCTCLRGEGGRIVHRPEPGARPITVIECGRASLGTLVAIAVVVTILLALVGVKAVGAQELTDPVSYEVGDVLVYASVTRNPSCSITRGIVNNGDVPLRVLGSAFTDDHLEHILPNQGTFDGDQVIAPGERVTAVWTNHDYLPDAAAYLAWSVMLDVDVDQVGATHLEAVPACQPPTPDGPDTTPPSVPDEPPTDTLVPPATSTPTGPPPSTSVVSVPVEPPPTVPGPETTTTTIDVDCAGLSYDEAQDVLAADPGDPHGLDADLDGVACEAGTGVLEASSQRTHLARTGVGTGLLTAVGATLAVTGLICLAFLPARRRLAALREDGAR